MKADLQTHTDGAWIPLHSDNRNISLNSVAVTWHRSYGSRSLSNNLVMAASELGQRQWTWGPQFVRMRSQEYIYKNTNHCYTNTADIVRKKQTSSSPWLKSVIRSNFHSIFIVDSEITWYQNTLQFQYIKIPNWKWWKFEYVLTI